MAGVRPTLGVDLNGVRLPTPAMVASGCFGTGRELAGLVDPGKFGGVVSQTVTLKPVKGVATSRMAETPSGLLWTTGLQNPGVEVFLGSVLPGLAEVGIPVFVSVGGTSVEEFVRVTALLQGKRGIAAVEANLSCPDLERGGLPFSSELKPAVEVVGAMSRLSMLPVFAKLTADTPELVEIADACSRAGAHGITLSGPLQGMSIDTRTFRPRLAAGTGWLSGPAIHPVAVAAVFRVARAIPTVPLIGVGGVQEAEDAIELLLAGAWAVQVGTAMFANPQAPLEVAQGILRYLKDKGLVAPGDLRGRVRVGVPERRGGTAGPEGG
ncbi:MAG: dihydroorotate dehydrogenase [Actinobacteria bacterium]|nr:dihydroorotate dehydrogenase [Actinomycetota bacterium]